MLKILVIQTNGTGLFKLNIRICNMDQSQESPGSRDVRKPPSTDQRRVAPGVTLAPLPASPTANPPPGSSPGPASSSTRTTTLSAPAPSSRTTSATTTMPPPGRSSQLHTSSRTSPPMSKYPDNMDKLLNYSFRGILTYILCI